MRKGILGIRAILKQNWVTVAFYFLATCYVFFDLYKGDHFNNFIIYSHSFAHLKLQTNLYNAYPAEYADYYLYGPIFAVLIAPFAWFPAAAGALLWLLFLTFCFLYAFESLPLGRMARNAIGWLCLNEFILSQQYTQANALVAALILLAFVFFEKQNLFLASLMVALGFWIKIYGVVAIVFVLFHDKKAAFILYFLFWSALFLLLPMLFSGPPFVLHSYLDWFQRLSAKNALNNSLNHSIAQNISFLGMVHRGLGFTRFNDLWILAPVAIVMGATLMRLYKRRKNVTLEHRFMLLAWLLMSVVLFSTSSENCTYIIAFAGLGIWAVLKVRVWPGPDAFLLIFSFLFSSIVDSDLVSASFKTHVAVHDALKAFPISILWMYILWDFWRPKQLANR